MPKLFSFSLVFERIFLREHLRRLKISGANSDVVLATFTTAAHQTLHLFSVKAKYLLLQQAVTHTGKFTVDSVELSTGEVRGEQYHHFILELAVIIPYDKVTFIGELEVIDSSRLRPSCYTHIISPLVSQI